MLRACECDPPGLALLAALPTTRPPDRPKRAAPALGRFGPRVARLASTWHKIGAPRDLSFQVLVQLVVGVSASRLFAPVPPSVLHRCGTPPRGSYLHGVRLSLLPAAPDLELMKMPDPAARHAAVRPLCRTGS